MKLGIIGVGAVGAATAMAVVLRARVTTSSCSAKRICAMS